MAQVVSEQPLTLESSINLSRPDIKLFTRPDSNFGATDVSRYLYQRSRTQLNLPTSTGPRNYDVSYCDERLIKSASKPKHRIEMGVIDPITGFLSPAGENFLKVKNQMGSFGKARLDPQCVIPQKTNSIRTQAEAINELRRTQEEENDPGLKWNSQKIHDNVLKSRLGGWTSLYDPRNLNGQKPIENQFRLKDIYPVDDQERDRLANKHRYTTSTQEMYQQVNWDNKLPKKKHAPVTTYEGGKADPLKNEFQHEHSRETAERISGSSWDMMQLRRSYFTRQPVAFTAPTKRANQIPGYSGHINGIQMDDVVENYKPLVVVRTKQPKDTYSNFYPNIPGYTGKYHFTKTTNVSHHDSLGRPLTTTAAFHNSNHKIDKTNNVSSISGDFSKILTKVPPKNPFDNVQRSVDIDVNNSIDNVKQPIVNPKATWHQDYMIQNRDKELKSILKKSSNN